MAITADCGHHCGIANGTEAHCDCAGCHNGAAGNFRTVMPWLLAPPRSPMCDRWYERSGGMKPWEVR